MKLFQSNNQNNQKNDLKCKQVLGKTVCTYKADVVAISADKKNPIPVTAYVSRQFPNEDKELMTHLKKCNQNLNNVLDIKKQYIEDGNVPDDIYHFPSVKIGSGIDSPILVGIDWNAQSLLVNAQKYLSFQNKYH